jgi:hypothetical protein
MKDGDLSFIRGHTTSVSPLILTTSKEVLKMDKRLMDVIGSIDYYELLKMKKDLESGGVYLGQFLKDEIKKREKQHGKCCSQCTSEIDSSSTSNFTLLFGSEDFKKKATFCGKDCLEYFLKNLNSMKKGENPKTILS